MKKTKLYKLTMPYRAINSYLLVVSITNGYRIRSGILRNMRNNPPFHTIFVGNCRASIFRNLVVKDGKEIELPKVVLDVRYRDKTGRWKSTSAMTLRELPKAILALQQAFEYMTAAHAHA